MHFFCLLAFPGRKWCAVVISIVEGLPASTAQFLVSFGILTFIFASGNQFSGLLQPEQHLQKRSSNIQRTTDWAQVEQPTRDVLVRITSPRPSMWLSSARSVALKTVRIAKDGFI